MNKTYTYKRYLSLLLIVFLCSLQLLAQQKENGINKLFDLSLTDLISIKVVSKKTESITESPAVVSKIYMSNMKNIGIHSLYEALNHIPGVLVIDGGVGNKIVTIRGVGEVFNQKVLFMVDGTPYYMSSHSDIPLLGIPISSIDYIEVIRGPGSVLHGTNASAGVINVVLKKDLKRSMIQVRGGSQGLLNTGIDVSVPINQDGNFFLGLGAQKMLTGYNSYYPYSRLEDYFVKDQVTGEDISNKVYWKRDRDKYIPLPTSGTINRVEEYFNIIGGVNHKGFKLICSAFQQERTGLGSVLAVYQPSDAIFKGSLVHAEYRLKKKNWTITPYIDHNIMFLEFHAQSIHWKEEDGNHSFIKVDDNHWLTNMDKGLLTFEDPWRNNYRIRYGSTCRYSFKLLNNNDNLFFGFEHEQRSNGRYIRYDEHKKIEWLNAQPAGTVNETSLFGQAELSFFNQLKLVAGGRYVNNGFIGNRFTPRGSLVYYINKKSTLKLLYSEGFNSPNLHQLYADLPNVKGNKNLNAESIRNWDFAYTYSSKKHLFVINLYYLQLEDIIARVRQENTTVLINSNIKGFDRQGAEVDYQYLGDRMKIRTSLSYQHQGNEEYPIDITAKIHPKFIYTLGATYIFNNHFSIGISEQMLSKRKGYNRGLDEIKELAISNLTNLNFTYNWNTIRFDITLYNIFDSRQENPDLPLRVYSLQNSPGRSIYFGINFNL